MFEHKYPPRPSRPQPMGAATAECPHPVSAVADDLCAGAHTEARLRITRKGGRLLAAFEARRMRRAA